MTRIDHRQPKEHEGNDGAVNIPPEHHKENGHHRPPDSMLAVWGLLVAVVVALIYAGQLYEMRQATEAAQRAFVTGQRPWLGIEPNPIAAREGPRWKVIFKVKNYGLSPSLHSAFASEMAEAPLTSDEATTKIEAACSRGEKLSGTELYPKSSEGHGYTVFPGVSQSQEITMLRSDSQTSAYLLGCLTYLDGWRGLHHTRFCQVTGFPINVGSTFAPCFGGQNAD